MSKGDKIACKVLVTGVFAYMFGLFVFGLKLLPPASLIVAVVVAILFWWE